MKKNVLILMTALSVYAISVNAQTVAYWRFEEGPAGAPVSHGGQPDGVYYEGTADSSGNGYGLSVWAEGWAGYAYRSDVGYGTVPLTSAANNFAVKNTGGLPAMFTNTADAIGSISPSAFTIEATFKLENGGYRTIVGRDSEESVTTGNLDLAALYFQAVPNNALAIKFCDVQGYWHEAISAENIFTSFDYPTNPDGIGVPWYSMAAVSDGTLLTLYLLQHGGHGWQMIAQTNMTASGSTDTSLTVGLGSGSDWTAGEWSVGRGLYNGRHEDRAWGYIDEVRISDSALDISEFLVPEPTTIMLLGLGALTMLRKRK